MRDIIFANGEYYHIYNRGVDKRDIFLDDQDFWKFVDCLRDFNNTTFYEERLNVLGISKNSMRELQSSDFQRLGSFLSEQQRVVEIISYILNPNHFHLIIKQLVNKGISNFMHKLGTSYPNYFNKRYERSGALFQGAYKIIHIDSNEYFLWLLGYVNGNIEIHGIDKAEDYSWSSYQAIRKLLGNFPGQGQPLSKLSVLSGLEDIVLPQFRNESEFKKFVEQVIKESRTKKEMEKYLLEDF